ncbi:TIGR03557 family F420-dependent LLM class oxidoreductase [Lapillicoccus jejuensis]|uniref:G6PDH family F420-dependent oxidoreductase n=1 Tax=Lapillicoccus jejuensis TaxID=402171 RepID=A0A542DXJ4_9MICO|nr:TIGR03557 family F420-dependent LLM class oxidoreductase [Lapillicoccus jejuensis]TQJ07813.1 G6PDH family F420-dependent oxidoreductase [Lapillicoccus jejuensis]
MPQVPDIGYFLSCEEYAPDQLLEQARLAEEAGFDRLWISDHFHPWTKAQGQSPLVWSMIGAVSQVCDLPVSTAVTCPTIRVHPAIVAQAAATSAVLLGEGRFTLGVGSGEALNEHVHGDPWPEASVRLEMLEEAVEVIRALWTGEVVSHRGRHYTVENARIYTRPETPPDILVSGFGPKAVDLAARIGDGYVTTSPDRELLDRFRSQARHGARTQAGYKVAWAPTRDEGIDAAHRIWPNAGLPGELAQVLPTVEHFEQASTLVTREATAGSIAAGPDAADHVEAFQPFLEAGFDEVYVANMGPHYADMIRAYGREVLPQLRRTAS